MRVRFSLETDHLTKRSLLAHGKRLGCQSIIGIVRLLLRRSMKIEELMRTGQLVYRDKDWKETVLDDRILGEVES